MTDRTERESALGRTAQSINATQSLDETLSAIVHVVRGCAPEMQHVGIALTRRDGDIEPKASTDGLALELDAIQHQVRQGPTVEAMGFAPVVMVEHVRHEQRWPRYIPRAVKAGVRAQLSLQLFCDDRVLGGLSVYSTSSDTFDTQSARHATHLATHAARAVRGAQREAELRTALESRKVIGQAIGLTMARFRIDEDRAFDSLVRISQGTNVKLRDIAAQIVAKANGDHHTDRPSTTP